jgi:hypothetical protein
MNRIQFYVVTGFAALLFILVVSDIVLAHKVSSQQIQAQQDQQILSQGQQVQQNLRALLTRMGNDLQKTGDQGMKDLLTRQQISIKGSGSGTNATDSSAAPSAPSTH